MMNLLNEQIAAISVFGAYKSENRDAYDVIADFVKASISVKKEIEITPEILQDNIKELYSLNIPISIIKGVIRNRLNNIMSKSGGRYIVNILPQNDISSKINELLKTYEVILSGLKSFLYETLKKDSISKFNDDFIVSQFAKFIIDDYADEYLTPYFSAYII